MDPEQQPAAHTPPLAVAARAARAGAYEWNLTSGEILWDDAVRQMIGAVSDEIEDRASAFLEALDPADAARVPAAIAEVIERGGVYRNHYQVTHADGGVRQLEERGEVLLGPDGRPERVTGLLIDRTGEGADPGHPGYTDRSGGSGHPGPVGHTGHSAQNGQDGHPCASPSDRAGPSASRSGDSAADPRPTFAAGATDAFLLTLTRALARAASVSDVTRVMTDIARPALGAENLLINTDADLADLSAGTADPHVSCTPLRSELHPLREAAWDAMRRAVREEQPLFLEGIELPSPPPVNGSGPSVNGHDGHGRCAPPVTRSWTVLPLSGSDGWRGACLFGFSGTRAFDESQRTLFTAIAGILAHSLSRARLYDTEHTWAAELQRAMLPRRLPIVPDHSTAVRYLPGTTGMAVGGDWYDLLQLPDGRVGLVVGDVQGHSVEASAVMGQLRIALRAYAAEGHSPGTVLARTGRLLAELDTDLFATCCYLSLDPATGSVSAARAGHPQPARIHAGQGTVVELDLPGGPPLGVDPAACYPESETVLAPGETLLLYTDGLIETRHEDIDTSLERLLATVRDWVGSVPDTGAEWLGRLADHLVLPRRAQSPRADDVAVFLIQHDLVPDVLTQRQFLTV
jgi:hypothetical protein